MKIKLKLKKSYIVGGDESGDGGFDFARGSSLYFVLLFVIFENAEDARAVDKAISQFKARLGIKGELKFSDYLRMADNEFFKFISQYNFKIRCVVVDKKKIYRS